MEKGRDPITKNGFKRLVKWFGGTGSLKDRYRNGQPKLSLELTSRSNRNEISHHTIVHHCM